MKGKWWWANMSSIVKEQLDIRKVDEKFNEFVNNNQLELEGNEVDIINISNKLGFEVGVMDMFENEDGFIYVDIEKQKKLIVVNSNLPLQSKRFTIAHELAHFVLHSGGKTLFAHRDHKNSAHKNKLYEDEADYFAACLLMPEKTFREIYDNFSKLYKDNISSNEDNLINMCSYYFNTPIESVRRRICELKLS